MGSAGVGGMAFGWPELYAAVGYAPKNAAFYWLTHAAATVWFLSLIGFFIFLALLTAYWPALSYIWDGLGFLIEMLSLFI